MKIRDAINQIEKSIVNPTAGLPEEVFYFVSRITPLINVDLLIKNSQGETLLTWRADNYGPPGWHIPGGIIRYKETMKERITAVAKNELNVEVKYAPLPLAINEIILERKDRGHFISLLYGCQLVTPLDEKQHCLNVDSPKNNEWLWHKGCPKNIIPVHDEIYGKYL
ncbi:MAG: NUDIX domain-containing protein [Candidatus Margulisiibacteriota bacterium]